MFIIAKLVGYRQISEISMFDYINSITLGSIAADLAISENLKEATYCIIAMTVFGAFTVIFALISIKSKTARRILVGEPIVLMSTGKLYQNSLKKARLDLDEFLSMCRAAGYFNPAKIDTAILEPTGKLSVIPSASEKTITPNDMKIPSKQEGMCADLIKDGKIQNGNLRRRGLSEKWLNENLKLQGIKSETEILLATVDIENNLSVFQKCNTKKDNIL